MPRTKPTVNTRCVANNYAAANERIIEFSDPNGAGGLVSFKFYPETGDLVVDVYRTDKTVTVRAAPWKGASKMETQNYGAKL